MRDVNPIIDLAEVILEKVGYLVGLKPFNLNTLDLCPVSFRRQPGMKFHLIAGKKCVSANADCEAHPRGPVNL